MFSTFIDEVLTELPAGKKHLGSKTAVTQHAQKGSTCWYYVFNNLRARYGKAFPDSHPERQKEKIFSAYRKGISKLEAMPAGPEKVALSIQLYQNILGQLGIDPSAMLKDILSADSTEQEKAKIYRVMLRLAAADAYGLIPSDWNPNDGISSLIATLRTHGACYIGGSFGVPFYSKPAHKLEEPFQGMDVYGWNPGEYRNIHNDAHSLTIVGAKQIDKKGYVYFMDPNEAHGPATTPKIYVMSYERLLAGIVNFSGGTNNVGAFAVHANQKKLAYLHEFQQFLADYNKNDFPEDFQPTLRYPDV